MSYSVSPEAIELYKGAHVVTRNGDEIEFFPTKADAEDWQYIVYGKRPGDDNTLRDQHGFIKHQHGRTIAANVCLMRSFGNKKDAGAWLQHIYGLRIYPASKEGIFLMGDDSNGFQVVRDCSTSREVGVEIVPLTRGPKAGDYATYKGGGKSRYDYLVKDRESISGILDHVYDDDSFGLCFSASCYREWGHISSSGGPVPRVKEEDLTFVGLHSTRFWRWHDGMAGASQGGDYYINVPHWVWNGGS